jgi:peptide subunit release factor 1 (eRF1)
MSSAPATARQLLERPGDHPVISLYFDLDPEEFATAPARATQARALIDEAKRLVEADESLDHDDRSSLASDVSRLDDYLASDDLPVSGVRALAIFSSRETDLFETVTLSRPTASNVFISRSPHVEPLVVQGDDEHWCAVLVTSRTGHVYRGKALQVTTEEKIGDYVRGHSQGGAAGENTQEQDIEGHLLNLARAIYHDWQREPFSTLALGGPVESATRLQELLHNDLRPTLAASHLGLDVASATASDLEAAIAEVLDAQRQANAGRALEALTETTRAVTGAADTLEALNEHRVKTLLLSRDFSGSGGRCPSCGLLVAQGVGTCPADGTPIDPAADLREAAVQAAVVQNAAVIAFDEPQDELGPARPIAALLRF